MFTKTINYKDFDGNNVTETCYFHLFENDLIEIAMDLPDDVMEKVVDGVKAKVSVDKLSGALGSLKKLF